jgi:hypothetical protein
VTSGAIALLHRRQPKKKLASPLCSLACAQNHTNLAVWIWRARAPCALALHLPRLLFPTRADERGG